MQAQTGISYPMHITEIPILTSIIYCPNWLATNYKQNFSILIYIAYV